MTVFQPWAENCLGNPRLSSHAVGVHLAAFSGLLRFKKVRLESEIVTLFPLIRPGRQGLDLLRRKKKRVSTTPPISSWLESRMFWCVNLEKTELGRHQHRSGWRREVQGQSSHSFSGQVGFLGLFLLFFKLQGGRQNKRMRQKVWRTHMQRASYFSWRNNTCPQILLDTLNLKAHRTMGFSKLKSKQKVARWRL